MARKLLKLLSIIVLGLISTASFAGVSHVLTTELQEVRSGTINGEEYLTIHIESSVGPIGCQGNVLRVDSGSMSQPGKQQAMESIALEAMLTSERVVLTIPLGGSKCVDGMPTLSDINLLNQTH